MIIGIISYLPDNEEVRQQRLKYHKKQIDLLLKLDCKIYIVAQKYREDEYISNPNIYYFKYDEGIGPSSARNCLLNYFYNSDEDFMLYCDDDSYFYDYYDIFNFFTELKNYKEKFNKLDFIRGISANKLPFKKTVYEDINNLKYYVFEDLNTIGSTSICITRNFKQYYNKEIYYEDMNISTGAGYEDKDFCCKLKLSGISTHVLKTFIISNYNYTDNSTIFETYEERMKVHDNNNNNIYGKYKDTDLFDITNKLNPKYKSNKVFVEREKEMVISENLIPVYKNKAKGSLF